MEVGKVASAEIRISCSFVENMIGWEIMERALVAILVTLVLLLPAKRGWRKPWRASSKLASEPPENQDGVSPAEAKITWCD